MSETPDANTTEMTRRTFLSAAAGGVAITALTPAGQTASGQANAGQTTSARRLLAEPGPMIPPVPAILLTEIQ